MILDLLSFFIGFILIILVPIILLNNKNRKGLNIYFLLIIGIAGLQRFTNGLVNFDIIESNINPFHLSLQFAFFIPPLFFLFFANLLFESISSRKTWFVFIMATVTILTSEVFNFNQTVNQFVFLLYSSIYIIFLFIIFRKYLSNKKNQRELYYYRSIKIWATVMFLFFVMIFIYANYIFNLFLFDPKDIILNEFNNVTSIIWLVILLYILMNPEILYGEQFLQQKLNRSTIDEIKIWKKNKSRATEDFDIEVEKKVKPYVENILLDLIKFENNLFNDFDHMPTLKELAIKLDCPQSHIKYIFKYYSHYSFSEYLNVLKINYAIKLIHDNYLSTQTIDSLSQKCLFKSRNTFFRNFKKLLGYSPTDYKNVPI